MAFLAFLSIPWIIAAFAMSIVIAWCMYDSPEEDAFVPNPRYGVLNRGAPHGLGALICAAIFVVAWWIAGDFKDAASTIFNAWVTALIYLSAHLVVGAGYALYRWKRWFMPRWEKRYLSFKRSFLSNSGIDGTEIPDSLRAKWMTHLERSEYGRRVGHPGDPVEFEVQLVPTVSNYKWWIGSWIIWWPWSAASYFFHDFVLDLANWAYLCIKGLLEKIAFAQMRKYDNDIVRPAKTENV